jgi:hypothetical protein
MDKLMEYVPLVLTYVGGVVAALVIIAPVTPTKWDDKVLAALQKFLAAVKLLKAKPSA